MPTFLQKYKFQIAILLSIIYASINFFLIIEYDVYWFLAFPLFLLLIYFYLFSYEKILLLVFFCTPLAINLNSFNLGYSVSFPTEPLLAGLVILFLMRLLSSYPYPRDIIRHPVSLLLIAQLIWMLFTSISSEYPLISFKYFFSRVWFIVPFYFMLIPLFKERKRLTSFYWIYTIPLIAVIGYTIFRHSLSGFDEEIGHWVMSPFYNDHTAYGAVLALLIPFFAGKGFSKIVDSRLRFIALVVFAILSIAIFLSFSRAAWLSVAAAVGVFLLIKWRIHFKWVFLGFALSLMMFFYFQDDIVYMLEKNKQESSENMAEHLQSISNISSDASNLERINRWQAAARMFNERPILGWGPGTYQFVYAPFQKFREKTEISTNAGNMGSVHSEYLGPLAEMGIIGLLLVVLLLVYVFKTGINFYIRCEDSDLKLLSLVSVLGLVSFFTHGLLNNFLETDKLALPVYGFIAIIVSLDLYHKKNPEFKPRT